MSILSDVITLLNKARVAEAGCWAIERELFELRDGNRGLLDVVAVKDEKAFNALMVIVFGVSTRFFIVSQDGTHSEFYLSAPRLDDFCKSLNGYVSARGAACRICGSICSKSHETTTVPDGVLYKQSEITSTTWKCTKCNNTFMDAQQEADVCNKLNTLKK